MPVLPLIISSEWLCLSIQESPVKISRSSLFRNVLLIWRLRSLLWVMNNTLLFLIRDLHKHWLAVSSGAGSREWFQLAISQHQHWFPTKPQLIPWGVQTSTPAPIAFSVWLCNRRRILHWTKTFFQVTFCHSTIILLWVSHCKICSAIHKPGGLVAIPGLRTPWHPRTSSQLYQRQTPLLHQFTQL